jgi:hypothetical protein
MGTMVDPLANARWDSVPAHLRRTLHTYLLAGTVPLQSPFLLAVIANDLAGAVEAADVIHERHLFPLVRFLRDYAPQAAWGAPERIAFWEELGGLAGRSREDMRREGNA